jgi:uncharacterized protein (TIGR02391 family)
MREQINSENHSPTLQDCEEWLEMDWWTPEEACFALLGLDPSAAIDGTTRVTLAYWPEGKRVKDLIDRAVSAGTIPDLEHLGGFVSGYYRAPCQSWISWAKTKKSISIDPSLVQAADLAIPEQKTEIKMRTKFSGRNFHPSVSKHAEKFLNEGNFASAVFEVAKAFEKEVKHKAQIEDFGASLMSTAFSLKKGVLKLNQNNSETERNEQEGIMHLARGFMLAIRNPQSHEPVSDRPILEEDAIDLLSFMSFLWRQLDKCQHNPKH